MDRSFLSNPAVVAASRDFVCVRLATYEDVEEAKLLTSLFTGRSGELENSVFAVLAPDGRERLARTGRSPSWEYRDAADMAAGMAEIAKRYPGKSGVAATVLGVPYLANVRLALNVASCDAQRLVIAIADSSRDRARYDAMLSEVAWGDEQIGKLLYVRAKSTAELAGLTGLGDVTSGIVVVEPDELGVTGKVVAQIRRAISATELAQALASAAAGNELGSKSTRTVVRDARRRGVAWKTVVPVTDSKSGSHRKRR